MKRKINMLFRFICLVLCVVMAFSVIACNDSKKDKDKDKDDEKKATDIVTDESEANEETEPVETAKVVVISTASLRGNLLSKSRVTLADVPVTELPIDPITNIDDVVGKYLLLDSTKGTCLTPSMISDMDPLVSLNGLGTEYVLITDVINANPTVKDMAVIIQKAVDENPGKTIYFPDGKYQLSKTVVIPSDPSKSVSFRLSNYAHFSPSMSWDSECKTLIQYGMAESPKTQSGDHADYFMGGILDGNNKVTAIEVYGGGRLFINNVSIKDARIGVHIKPNGAYNDIENVNVTSPYENASRGIFVEGTNNTFVNMRIYHPFIGAHLTGGDNVLINIHPLGNPTNNSNSAGFYDQSTGNRYSICYSDQYPIGFKIESQTVSYFDMCYMYWWQACNYQIGFLCVGEFNSIISDTVVSMQNVNTNTQNHYLYFTTENEDAETEQTPSAPENSENEEENNSESGGNKPSGQKPDREQNSGLTQEIPSGSGIIINPTIQSSRNNDSDTYLQFVYNPN